MSISTEVQALIERRVKLQDDIRDAVVGLVKEFEFETGVDIKTIAINGRSIKVAHILSDYNELAAIMGDDQPQQEIRFVTRIGLDI